MRLLHTSDWHLGSRFFGRSLIGDQAYVLDQMINLVRDLNPDVLVVSGDIFHHRRPSEEALALFHDTVGRLLDFGTQVIVLSGPADDLSSLHLSARWVRQQGLYLYADSSQVLSPLSLRGARDSFSVNAWCLPFARNDPGGEHPAQIGRGLVEKVVQRLDPGAVNLFAGYIWAQGVGKRSDLGALVGPGGQPVEKRLLEYFDYAALGGSHEPLSLGPATVRYSGGLLANDVELENSERSVTLVMIEGKNNILVDEYPLRPRRSFRLLTGSVEELAELGREQRSDDLLVLRSQELELSAEQKARLRSLGSNIVSVETASPLTEPQGNVAREGESPLLSLLTEFHESMGGVAPDASTMELLRHLEAKI